MLAGFCIAIGCMLYLKIGGVIGALFFSLGLLTVLYFKFNLFTGKAGLLVTKEISPLRLLCVWFANLFGVALCATIISFTPLAQTLVEGSQNIVAIRLSNGFLTNVIYAFFCGIFMYIAVNAGYTCSKILWIVTAACVAAFILMGFNHVIADMFYCFYGCSIFVEFISIIGADIIGNLVGCCFIPGLRKVFEDDLIIL